VISGKQLDARNLMRNSICISSFVSKPSTITRLTPVMQRILRAEPEVYGAQMQRERESWRLGEDLPEWGVGHNYVWLMFISAALCSQAACFAWKCSLLLSGFDCI